MSYRDFLNYLLSLGPKLPALLAEIEIILGSLERIRDLFGGGLVSGAASDEDAALEAQVIAAAQGENMAGPLQNIIAFIRNNPELIALLLKFLK